MTDYNQDSAAAQPDLDNIRIERARPWVRDVQFAQQAALIMRAQAAAEKSDAAAGKLTRLTGGSSC
jgi:hypothetical protein